MIQTKRTIIEILPVQDASLLLNYYVENQAHLAPWEPIRGEDYLTLENWRNVLQKATEDFESGKEYRFVALTPDRQEVIAVCNFTGVVPMPFQACFLGYSISKKYEGQGVMTEVLSATIDYMLTEVGLNRIMANYIPRNERSGRVLEKLGFEREGYARRYLNIAGVWEDHVLTAKVNG